MKIPRKVKRGDAVVAADYNDLLDYVRSLAITNGPGYRVKHGAAGQSLSLARNGQGRAGAGCAFEPYNFKKEDKFYAGVVESKYVSNRGKDVSHTEMVPVIGDEPIINPDAEDDEWEAPKVELSDGEWAMWRRVSSKACKIIIQKTDEDDPKWDGFIDVWKLATFTVVSEDEVQSVEDLILSTCSSLEHSRSFPQGFEPHLWSELVGDEVAWKAFFTPAFFPNLNWDDWQELDRKDFAAKDSNIYNYSFMTIIRKSKTKPHIV